MSLVEKFDQNRRKFDAENRERFNQAVDTYDRSLNDTLDVQGTKTNPSRPGEAPHRVTGRLQASIERQVDEAELEAAVGTTASYGRFLLPTRDYLQIAFNKVSGMIRQILLER